MHHLVVARIEPGMSGPQVLNVGRILRDLVARGAIKALEPPNEPTADQLRTLAQTLEEEINAAVFGDSIRQLVFYLQLQQGLGDGRSGVVEQATAGLLNQLVDSYGLPATSNPPPDLRGVDAFVASFDVSKRTFQVTFLVRGETKKRVLRLTPTAMAALLALKSSAKHFRFNADTQSLVATEELLPE